MVFNLKSYLVMIITTPLYARLGLLDKPSKKSRLEILTIGTPNGSNEPQRVNYPLKTKLGTGYTRRK